MGTLHHKFSSWLLVLLGVILLLDSAPKFLAYMKTGEAYYRHSRLIPYDLVGGDAALINGFYLLAGAALAAIGLRKLLFGK